MRSISPGIDRRPLISTLAALPAVSATVLSIPAPAQAPGDSLLSWNDGATKQAILDLVRATTDRSSPSHSTTRQKKKNWTVINVKNDWRRVFAFE